MTKRLAISVNGGGALGIGPLQFMCRLESDLKKSIADKAQAFGGTSTGAIIAACLSDGMNAHDVFDLYRANLKKIFTKYPWYKRLTAKVPTYDNTNLKKLLKENLKGCCSDWKKPTFITTTFMNGESVEKVWDQRDSDCEKWFAVLTSTAAPTYFDVVMDGKKSYCDGGMWANDPIMVLESGLKNMGESNFKILSFNTGMDTPNTESGNQTMIGWAEYIIGDWAARAGKSNLYEARANLGEHNIFCASPKCDKKIKMDDVSDKTVLKIIDIWDKYYDSVRDEVLAFIKR